MAERYVAHIDGIGLGNRIVVADVGESTPREHFRKLMTHGNMFVVPLTHGGIGELPEFCRAFVALHSLPNLA